MKTTNKSSIIFLVSIIIGIIVYGCMKKPIADSPKNKSINSIQQVAKYDTITSLEQMVKDTVIWKHDNEYVMVTHENSTDEEENEENEGHKITSGCSNIFAGSARAAAKTSYALPAAVTYANISALRLSLQTDANMHTKGLGSSSPRITEEKRNVNITSAYLYAISRESDNDYHMIIGDASHTPSTLLNCECGGLPSSTSSPAYTTINNLRAYIKSYFGTDFCNQSGYTKFSTPIHITVLKGSLFYDIDHSPGSIGPTGLRANTSWEMHPIHDLHF